MSYEISQEAPDLIGIGTQSMVARAKQLGLTWTRRLATVVEGSDASVVRILFDGDTEAVYAVSMVGALPASTRVYVDMVPPSANFIVGIAGGFNASRFGTANTVVTAGVGNTASATFAAVPGGASVTLPKAYVNTRIRIDLHTTCFTNTTGTNIQWAILFAGTTDGAVINYSMTTINSHLQQSGTAVFPWPQSGSITCAVRWRRVSGAGTFFIDANDFISLTAAEVV